MQKNPKGEKTMRKVLVTSKAEEKQLQNMLDKKLPTYRQAYSDRTAWIMACISELAYIRFNDCSYKKVTSYVENKGGARKPKNILKMVNYVEKNLVWNHGEEMKILKDELNSLQYKLVKTFYFEESEAFLAKNDVHLILAFRGTEAINPIDVKAQMKGGKIVTCETGGKVHSGFLAGYEKISLAIETELSKKKYATMPLFLTGHSLGGAFATIAAKKISHIGGNAACYTFGAPRVGNAKWIANIKTPLYRIVNAADFVPMLPPGVELVSLVAWVLGLFPHLGKSMRNWLLSTFNGYIHGGNMRYLTNCESSDYKGVKLLYSVSWYYRVKAFTIKKFPWSKPLEDHYIKTYRKKLFQVAVDRN